MAKGIEELKKEADALRINLMAKGFEELKMEADALSINFDVNNNFDVDNDS